MSYREYQRMIGTAKELPDGVTTKDFKYKEPNGSWYGTIYIEDGEPFFMAFYDWDATPEAFQRGLAEQLAEFEGEWEACDVSGGQGHYTAGIRRKS